MGEAFIKQQIERFEIILKDCALIIGISLIMATLLGACIIDWQLADMIKQCQ